MNFNSRSCLVYSVVLSVALALVHFSLSAQVIDVYSNYEERLGSRSTPTMLDIDTAFGAQMNIATGGVSFSVPVLSIPGNNGLDISVSYKLGIRNVAGATEWYFEEDEPNLSGSFSDSMGWVSQFGGVARCSNVNNQGYGPPNVPSSNGRPGTFYAEEYWSGYFLSTPGGGGRMNRFVAGSSNPAAPTTGGPYNWATDNLWYFSCVPLAVGSGEGFVGHSPGGLKYFFNTMRDGLPLPTLQKVNVQGSEIELERREIRLYAGRIEDRFGNYLVGLTASDGRNVAKTVSGSTRTYSYGGLQWVVQTSNPFTVTYPDGSVWKATVSGTLYDYISAKGSCPGDNRTLTPGATTATVNAPSGATAVYTLKQVLLGYSYVDGQCVPLDGGGNAVDRSSVMIVSALTNRVVSGPGLTTQSMSIDYGSSNDCYSNASGWLPKCSPTSPTWRTVTHSYSDGRYSRYTFGNRSLVNADLLIKLEEGNGAASPQRITEYEYSLMPNVGTFVGSPPHSIGEIRRPILVMKKVRQDGNSFNWKIASDCGGGGISLCIDQYGRPTKVSRWSSPE